jgi:hypothetical protein
MHLGTIGHLAKPPAGSVLPETEEIDSDQPVNSRQTTSLRIELDPNDLQSFPTDSPNCAEAQLAELQASGEPCGSAAMALANIGEKSDMTLFVTCGSICAAMKDIGLRGRSVQERMVAQTNFVRSLAKATLMAGASEKQAKLRNARRPRK